MDELRQSDLEEEFPGWRFWVPPSGLPVAERLDAAPPNRVWGEDWTHLRDEVKAWQERRS